MKPLEESIFCPLWDAAKEDPQKPAVIWGARRISFSQLNIYVNAAVRSLKERDIRCGHRAAVVSEISVEAVIVLLGLWRLGAVAVPLNPKLPAQSFNSLVASLNIRAVVSSRNALTSGVKFQVPHFEMTDLIVFEHKEMSLSSDEKRIPVSAHQPAAVVLTSGSSGLPKAALLTYANFYLNARGSQACVPLDSNGRWLLSLPLYHVAGLGIIFRCLLARAAIVIAPGDQFLRLMTDGKITHVSLVSTQLLRLMAQPDFKKSDALQAVLLGGSAIARNIQSKALSLGLPIYLSYGLTEMASQVATGKLEDVRKPCAKPLPYREVKVNTDGEICVRGQTLFQGYLNGPDVILPVDDQGWFHTGDLGCLDDNGCLSVLGRQDDMFISGGENIHPQEIESAILKIPSVVQAVVVPKEDPEFGQKPVAFILWENQQEPWPESKIKEHLLKDLPKFKLPVVFYPWPLDHSSDGLKLNRSYFKEWVNRK